MPDWTLVDTHPTHGRTFCRPLDVNELRFLWDGYLNGIGDSVLHYELRLLNGWQDAHLFSDANIVRAWVSTKRRYPLSGATVQGTNVPLRPGVASDSNLAEGGGNGGDYSTVFASEPHFVVREHDLAVLRPGEIVFGEVADVKEAQQRASTILNGPRLLSDELLVQLHVFRETVSKRTHVLHLITLIAHCVADLTADYTFARCLLDTLARDGRLDSEPVQIPLEGRLVMAIPPVGIEPMHLRSLSPARRRWRRAVGIVILQLRMVKMQGGHTLPRRFTRSIPHLSTRICLASTSLTHAQTNTVTTNCRLHHVTFGAAYLALAQVAMTRVLYRRYLRGEISEEEWAHRTRQPHLVAGPLNLRPFLDKVWYERGGGGEFSLSLGNVIYQLPLMTLGAMGKQSQICGHALNHVLSDGAPSFSDLLPFDRFLHCTALVKKQLKVLVGHPLFFEIIRARDLALADNARRGFLQWSKHVENAAGEDAQGNPENATMSAVMDVPIIFAHTGSSFGNMDVMLPLNYPIPPSHPLSPYAFVSHPLKAGYDASHSTPSSAVQQADTPSITIDNFKVYYHVHSSQLYLGAYTLGGRLTMYATFDGNTFEEAVVKEWMDEVNGAVLWYLGQTYPPRLAQQRDGGGGGGGGGGDRQAGLDKGVIRAKL